MSNRDLDSSHGNNVTFVSLQPSPAPAPIVTALRESHPCLTLASLPVSAHASPSHESCPALFPKLPPATHPRSRTPSPDHLCPHSTYHLPHINYLLCLLFTLCLEQNIQPPLPRRNLCFVHYIPQVSRVMPGPGEAFIKYLNE